MRILTKVYEYFASVRPEIGRVSWPARREVLIFTVLVILLTLTLGIYLGLVDVVFQNLLRLLITK